MMRRTVIAFMVAVSLVTPTVALGHHRPGHSAKPTPTPSAVPTPLNTPTPTATATPVPPADNVTFFDDFNSLDATKWGITEWPTTGLSTQSDNMNNLSQCIVANGMMTLRVERGSTPSGRAWRSCAISTTGKFSQLYGTFTMRAKYVKGQGLWPAFWLLQQSGSGRRPEIDALEAYPFGSLTAPWPAGGGPTQYAMTEHHKRADGSCCDQNTFWVRYGSDLTLDWHEFQLEWRKGLMITRIDGVEYGRITSSLVPAVPMFVILDHVVGGWAGQADSTTPSPADFQVDWVKVTQ